MPKGRRRKDSGSDAATEDPGTVGTFETLRDEGEHFVHVKQWEKAIESFSKALEMKTGDKTCLVVRAKCFLMLGNSEKALADADAALEQDGDGKRDIRALCMKAEALYQKGDFETALVFYHRGNKLRSELQEFRLGIQKCQEAIDNSIGSPSSVKLEASGDLSYFYKQNEKQKQNKGYSKSNQPQKKDEKKERQRPKDGTNSKTTKELLGQLYEDKEYLEKLFDNLSGSNSQTDTYIKDRACDGIEYLKGRSDFWLQQNPMYARKRERQKQTRSSKGKINNPERYILRRLEKIDEDFAAGNYEESLDKSQDTLKKLEEYPEDAFSNKAAYEASLHSCMGNAYFELERYSEALTSHQKDLNIAKDHQIADAESRALDNIGRTHAKLGNFEDAIDIWSKKLPLSQSAIESTWLYHEIGRCYLELGQYEEAKDYGEKSLAAAKEADDPAWVLHAYVLTAQSEVKCGEYEAATESFTQALDLAEEQDDVSGQKAIKRALEEVNSLIVKGEQQGADEDDGTEKDEKASNKDESDGPPGKAKGKAKGAAKEDKYEDETFESDSAGEEKGVKMDEGSKSKEDNEDGGEETTKTVEVKKEISDAEEEKNDNKAPSVSSDDEKMNSKNESKA